jgi:hypothetical protein
MCALVDRGASLDLALAVRPGETECAASASAAGCVRCDC